MQSFSWKYKYSGIFMVWCIGYLSDIELIIFLQRAKTQLITREGAMRRTSKTKSFIFVLENLLEEYE